jgi:CNT family concentrative nucleoside transporter
LTSGFVLVSSTAPQLVALKDGGLDLTLAQRAIGLLGVAVMLAIAWLVSYDRRRIPWRLVVTGLALQAGFGVLVLKTAAGRWFFERVGDVVNGLLAFTAEGARFVFGNLTTTAVPVGVPGPGNSLDTAAGYVASTGAFFAFGVLPTIVFLSSLMSVLYHLGLMQAVVKAIAWVMQRSLGTSGAETLCASANIFMGQTEAPLLIKPFVPGLTSSELVAVMTGGFATAAAGVIGAYTLMLQPVFPGIAGHLLAASVMNAPAGLLLAKMILPETGEPASRGFLSIVVDKTDANVIDAAASGAALGVRLAINVAAMLMAFIALIAMLNFGIGWLGGLAGLRDLTIQSVLGGLLRPLAWVMGVPWQDTGYVGGLIGVKATLNEFVAYAQLANDLKSGGVALEPRSAVIAVYALLGFANFSSIAIQIGGIGGLAPERRAEFARHGMRAMVAGHLAAFMSASLAGMML